MKKIFILAIGLFVATAASAQDHGIKFGIAGGLNVSDVIQGHGDYGSTNTKAGFNAGLTLEIPFYPGIAFAPEVMFSQKGYSLDYDTDAGYSAGKFTQTTNYIDVPLLFSFRVGPAFNFLIGPQVSFLTSTKNKFDDGFGTTEETTINNHSDNYNKTMIGGVVGFRYDITPTVDIHARYAIDFSQNDGYGDYYTPRYRNQVVSLGLGFKFQ
ncbi:porin family protein [Pedobacter sp. L105]|uniref:porin family protein n=1 Tax=Pedobacter sp. L105 TaxID=1641871 RepID=UPI00131E16E6|nr:porin family protein [Pedobacter sp. L105]